MEEIEKMTHEELFELADNVSVEIKRRMKNFTKSQHKMFFVKYMKNESTGIIRTILPKMFDFLQENFFVTEHEIVGKSRKRHINKVRHNLIYCILNEKNEKDEKLISLKKLGKLIGNRDHSTVINARDKVTEYVKTEEETKKDCEKISKHLKMLIQNANKNPFE